MIPALRRFLTADHSPWDTTLLTVVFVALFVPFLGITPLFDWDESSFAEAAREMLVRGNFLQVTLGFDPFYEKPPMFFWLQAASMAVFGVNEWAARLPCALAGIATLLTIFRIGSQIHDRQFGFLWIIAYAASVIPPFYFRSGFIDPVFNLLMFLAIWNLIRWDMAQSTEASSRAFRFIVYAGLSSGLAILTKGPVGFGMPMLSWLVFWGLFRRSTRIPILEAITYALISVVIGGSWLLAEFMVHGPAFISEFVTYQHVLVQGYPGQEQPIYYHVLTTLFLCFPASIIAFGGIRPPGELTERQRTLHRWMIVLFCCVMIVFSLVTTKIVHYVSLAYIPLAYLAAVTMHSLRSGGEPSRFYRATLIGLGLLWAVGMIGGPLALMARDRWAGLVTHTFTREIILAPVPWSVLDAVPGVVLLAGVLGMMACFARRQWVAGHLSVFAGVGVATTLLMPLALPKIYEHVQGPIVRFFRLAGEQNAYVRTTFRNYTQHFYSGETPDRSGAAQNMPPPEFLHWLATGAIDRPAYFVARGREGDVFAPFAEKIREESGYVLFKRNPPSVLPPAPAAAR